MASFDTNSTPHELVNVTIGVEEDDGIFLYLNADEDIVKFDLIATSAYEIEQFFEEVAQAKAEYERLKARG
jgi:hypothetical protein